jgi:cardiolipin synthase
MAENPATTQMPAMGASATAEEVSSVRHGEPEPGPGANQSATVRTAHHQVTLLPSLEGTITALERDIAAARKRVWIEIFIFRADAFGKRMVQCLARAAARGVDVRVLYDSLGSRTTPESFFTDMRWRGIDVRCYRPWHVALRALRLWPRDHARVLCIDDSVYTGGIGFGNEWLPKERGGLGWHDVCARVEGPVVAECARYFQQHWEHSDTSEDPRTERAAYPDVAFVADSPLDPEGVYPMYRAAVQGAKRRVWIENAYFAPPRALLRDLCEASARGVDVQIIVPSQSDVRAIAGAARAEYPEWLAHGLKVYEYLPGVTHAKFALVDDDFSTVGSFNINPTSLVCSRESNLFVFDPSFVQRLAAQFVHDREQSRKVSRATTNRTGLVEWAHNQLLRTGVRMFEHLSNAAGHPWS